MPEKRWWIIEVKGKYLGKVYDTEASVRKAVGPYAEKRGNSFNIWAPPPKPRKNPAYTPRTGARCSCRPGVQRDNCPRCEGTGWVIDFKKIHERREKNPAQWAHGTMDYRHPPGSVAIMQNNPRGGQHFLNAHRRRRYRRNPARRRGGGMGIGTIALLAGGALLLLPALTGGRSPLSSIFGSGTAAAAVPPGYTPIGNGLYRSPTGQVVARNPQTGQMVAAPAGSQPTSAEDLLVRAGISLIPAVTQNLASWVSSMFSTQQTSTGAVIPWGTPSGPYEEWGGALPEGESIFGGGEGGLPPLAPIPSEGYDFWGGIMPSEEFLFAEDLPPITDLPTYPTYYYDYYDYGMPGSEYYLPDTPTWDYDVGIGVGSGEVTIANPDEWYGYFGLGQRSRRQNGSRRPPLMGFRATPPVY